jgi:hypothetical protein
LAPQTAPTLAAWREQFQSGIDEGTFSAWLSDVDGQSQTFDIYYLINTLVGLAPSVALTALKACSPNLIDVIERDFAGASSNFSGWVFGSMYFVAGLSPAIGASVDDDYDQEHHLEPEDSSESTPHTDFHRRHEDELRQLAAEVLAVMGTVDWVAAARSLEKKELYELNKFGLLLHWLARLSVEIIDQIAETVSTDWLEALALEEMAASEERRIDGLSEVLLPLTYGPRGAAVVQAFLEKHEAEIGAFPDLLISRFPAIVVARVLAGRSVPFRLPRGASWGWELCARDLGAVVAVDREAGRRFLRASIGQLREAIEKPQENDVKGIGRFIEIADDLDVTALDELLGALNTEIVQQRWSQLHEADPDSMKMLLLRASRTHGAIGDVAQTLLA